MIARKVGYTIPSDFAQVFGRVVGVTPTKVRSNLQNACEDDAC
jgi:AraC-like DNA-binding protein